MKSLLSFGLEPYPHPGYQVTHLPLIEVMPIPFQEKWLHGIENCTHFLFTSKTAVTLFPFPKKPVLAVGKGTEKKALSLGFEVEGVAKEESQEGVIKLLKTVKNPSLVWPRSLHARPLLSSFCQKEGIPLDEIPIYSIRSRKVELPPLEQFQALFFSSPTTVDAFFNLGIPLPPHLELLVMGDVTRKYLNSTLCDN